MSWRGCLGPGVQGADILGRAGLGFELNGGVGDAEPFFQHPADPIEKLGPFADRKVGHLDVAA